MRRSFAVPTAVFVPAVLFYIVCFLLAGGIAHAARADELGDLHRWNEGEREVLRSLSLSSLPPLPRDPSNARADDPRAVALGKKFFFDTRFSANKKVSCATCHMPGYAFTDKIPLARGMGTTSRRTMHLIGVAYQSWFFWDGRKDSLWAQAIGPIESAVEHGVTRSLCAHLVTKHYKKEYEGLFGQLPKITHKSCPPHASPGTGNPAALKAWNAMKPEDREAVNRIYANIGKAIAAYVRRIQPGPAPFDRYVAAVLKDDYAAADKAMDRTAVEGLRLFIGPAHCTNCHSGPLFTNSSFHDVGLGNPTDRGRAEGIATVLADEFNCLGRYSDAAPGECGELKFMDKKTDRYEGAFKTPGLRNAADRPPYMHAGQFATLSEVLTFYRISPSTEVGHQGLSDEDIEKLEAFVRALSGPILSP